MKNKILILLVIASSFLFFSMLPQKASAATTENLPAEKQWYAGNFRCDTSSDQKDCYFNLPFPSQEDQQNYQAYKIEMAFHLDSVQTGWFGTTWLQIEACLSQFGTWSNQVNCTTFRPGSTYVPASGNYTLTMDMGGWMSQASGGAVHITVGHIYTNSDIIVYGRRPHLNSLTMNQDDPTNNPQRMQICWSTTNVPNGNYVSVYDDDTNALEFTGPPSGCSAWWDYWDPYNFRIEAVGPGTNSYWQPPGRVIVHQNFWGGIKGSLSGGGNVCEAAPVTLTYSTKGAANLIIKKDGSNWVTKRWDVEGGVGGGTVTDNPSFGSHTYTLYGYSKNWSREVILNSVTVNVVNCGPPPPSVNIKANGLDALTVPADGSAYITWSSSNSDNCTVTNTKDGTIWYGTQHPAADLSTGALQLPVTYTASCSGAGGTRTDSVAINVTGPTANITVNGVKDAAIGAGNNVTVAWSSTGASGGCSITSSPSVGSWSTRNDSVSAGPINALTTFSIACSGNGTANSSARVRVVPAINFTVKYKIIPLPLPTNLSLSNSTCEQARLTWTDNATTETSYEVYRSIDQATWTLISTLPANTTSFTDTTMTSFDRNYYYRVAAVTTVPIPQSSYSNIASGYIRNCVPRPIVLKQITGYVSSPLPATGPYTFLPYDPSKIKDGDLVRFRMSILNIQPPSDAPAEITRVSDTFNSNLLPACRSNAPGTASCPTGSLSYNYVDAGSATDGVGPWNLKINKDTDVRYNEYAKQDFKNEQGKVVEISPSELEFKMIDVQNLGLEVPWGKKTPTVAPNNTAWVIEIDAIIAAHLPNTMETVYNTLCIDWFHNALVDQQTCGKFGPIIVKTSKPRTPMYREEA
ncbi:MAG: hypothetical protein ACM3KM_03970, partial [Acidobacteriaceae bacterium]